EFDVEHRRRTAVRKKHTSADHGFCRRADRTFCFASDERYADAGRSREIVEADGPFFTALESTIEEASFAVGDERSAVVPKRDVRGWLSICENQASDDREPFLEHEVRFDVTRRRVEGEYRSETLRVSSHPGDEPNGLVTRDGECVPRGRVGSTLDGIRRLRQEPLRMDALWSGEQGKERALPRFRRRIRSGVADG